MDIPTSPDDLHSLIESIKSSDVVETRIDLVTKLGVAVQPGTPDLDALLEFLITLWEGFTCLDVTQCMLNKAILDVAARHLEAGSSSCYRGFLVLGAQANEWCSKHLKMTLMSTGDSQEEEHYSLFFQMLLECLKYSVGCFSLAVQNPTLEDELLMVALDKCFRDLLNLVKDLITKFKNIHSFTSELLKQAELVLDSTMKLCKVYSQAVNWDLGCQTTRADDSSLDNKGESGVISVTNLIKYAIEKLSELGTMAADSGGSLVTILNLSWKGVVSLLQLGGGALAEKVNVGEIILLLVSLATDSLRCAAETWSSSLQQTISVNEAKRASIPVKFLMINAVRISSQYSHQAFAVYREVTLFILLIATLRATFVKEMVLKNVCESMEELLKPTSIHLLKSLLNSSQLNNNQKLQILDWLFCKDRSFVSNPSDHIKDFQSSLDKIFSVNCEALPTARIFLIGQIVLFTDLLKVSVDLDEYVLLEIARKLQWFLDVLMDEDVYSFVVAVQIPLSCGEGKSLVLTWEPSLFSFLHALKIFMVTVYGTQAWKEVEFFLLDNFFHPHFLCWEIIMELWCFLLRYAESSAVNTIMDKLAYLYKLIACSDTQIFLPCGLRKMARSMCLLLASCPPSTVDRIYGSIVTDGKSPPSAVMYAALLMEGFQLNLLSDNVKAAAIERIFYNYIHFADDYIENPMSFSSSITSGIPVAVLCSALQSLQIDSSGIDKKTMQFLLAAIQAYKKSTNTVVKKHCCRLLSEALGIISTAKHLYGNDQMETVILELENMFISGPTGVETELQKCKPALASFVSSLGHIEIPECEDSEKTSAVWQLYHMLLRERHWALIHLAMSAFVYFAARSSCSQLWRFVPADAALSFDLEGATNANEERFMSEFKVFLEKERALPAAATFSSEQLELHAKDGVVLRELFLKNSYLGIEVDGCDKEDDGGNLSNKRRRLPDGFCRGMELLQNGLKIMGDGLCQWQQNLTDYAEFDNKIFAQFSRLEDTVNHLAGLADSR